MTKQELNRDIKRLYKNITPNNSEQFEEEFRRLYFADKSFEYTNLNNLKIMFRLNLRYRFIALHQFGLSIDL